MSLRRSCLKPIIAAACVALLVQTPAFSQAPQAASPARSAGLRVTLLGTAGGPPPHSTRSQPANLLQVGGRAYLIDAGENVGQQLMKAGVPSRAVDVAFITHMHWDHMLGLGYLMATGWMMGRTKPMPIFGPPGLDLYLKRELSALAVGEDIFRSQSPERPSLKALYPTHQIDLSEPTEIHKDDQVRVTAVLNSHFTVVHGGPASYGIDKSYSYRFDTAHGSVVFTGDTGPSDAVTRLARGADILVTEICDVESIHAAMIALNPKGNYDKLLTHMREQHLNPEQVGKLAADAGVKKLVLSHYVMGQTYDPQGFVARIRPFYQGEIVVGQDLARIDIDHP